MNAQNRHVLQNNYFICPQTTMTAMSIKICSCIFPNEIYIQHVTVFACQSDACVITVIELSIAKFRCIRGTYFEEFSWRMQITKNKRDVPNIHERRLRLPDTYLYHPHTYFNSEVTKKLIITTDYLLFCVPKIGQL